jgi:hypothetical protein
MPIETRRMKREREAKPSQRTEATEATEATERSSKKGKWRTDQHAKESGSPPPQAEVSAHLGAMAFRKSVEPEQPRQEEAGPSSSSGEPTARYDITTRAGVEELEASIRQDEVRARHDRIMQIVKNKLETLIQQEKTRTYSNDWGVDNYNETIGTLQQVRLIRKHHILPEIQNLSPNEDFNLLSLGELALDRNYGRETERRDKRSNSNNFVQAWDILAITHPAKLRKILGRAEEAWIRPLIEQV